MNIEKIKKYYQEFLEYSQIYGFRRNTYIYFIHWLILRYMYWIDMEGYFVNKVWQITVDHTEYYQQFHKYIHSWKYVFPRFAPKDHSQLFYKIDYWLSKIFCPGLDAMDYFRYEFYNHSLRKKRTFITEGGIARMDRHFNGDKKQKQFRNILADKPSFNRYFSEYINRNWICSDNLTFEIFSKFMEANHHVIVKPIDGVGGGGIFKAHAETDVQIKEIFSRIKGKKVIIEEVITQCEELRKLNPSSVNTVRVYTVEKEGNVNIIGALLRIGNGIGVTDNYSSGGLAATIDIKTGVIISPAVSQNNESVYVHPYTNEIIIGTQIPHWSDVLRIVENAHKKILQLRYIGWDVVVCEDGSVTFLEANTCSGVELQQHPLRIGVKPLYQPFL